MESTFRPVLILMAGRGVAFLATFFTPVVLVRTFDQAEFGTYKQLLVIYFTLYGIAQFGMAESLFYFLPGTQRGKGRYVLNAVLALAVSGAVWGTGLSAAGPAIAHWFSNGALLGLTGLLGAYLMVMLPATVLEIAMIARKRYWSASLAYGLTDMARAAAFIIPALLWQNLEWLLLTAIAFALLRCGAAAVYLRHEFAGELRPDHAALKGQLSYALPFQISVVLSTLDANLHNYAVSYYFDAATFAVYAVGCLQVPLVDMIFTPSGNVMMVRMSEKLLADRTDDVVALWNDTTRKLALVFFPLVACLLVTAHDLIVFLFTERYRASVPIFMIWSTAILLATLQTDGVLRVYAKTRFLMALYAIRVLLIAVLIPPSVAIFGLPGAILATVVAWSLGKALALARIRQLFAVRLAALLPWGSLTAILGVAAAAGVVASLVRSGLDVGPPLPRLAATGVAYGLSYVALVGATGLVSLPEVYALTRWPRRLTADRTGVER